MQEWVPENERDTRWPLWNRLFLCRVPFMQTMSKDYIRIHGVPMTGHVESDRSTHNELVQRMLSINQMVEFFKRGVTIAVVRAEETKEIYDYISAHLQAWRRELEVSLDVRNAPLEDLKWLDKLAASVYIHAQHYFTEEIVESILARRISGTMRVTRSTILGAGPSKANRINAIQEEEKPFEPKKHPSMADILASHEIASRPKWTT